MTETGKWKIESCSFADINVSVPTAEVAIIAYTVRQKVSINGKTQQMKAAANSTWVRGADGWECHAHSETPLRED